MRSLLRTVSALALAALVTPVPAAAASAKKHDLSGAWRAKDADKDGVKNLAEFKLGTNPRKADTDKDGDEVASAKDPLDADTDGDGTNDGTEHASVVTAFDGETITIRQSKGPKLTATLDDCNDVVADSSAEDEVGLGEDDEGAVCAFEDVEVGTVFTSAEFAGA